MELDREWGLYIDGETRGGRSTPTAVVDPATGERIAEVQSADPADAEAAVAAAAEAQPAWAARSPRDRSELLRATWARLMDAQDELAELIVAENGKTMADARGEVAYAAEFFRWNAEEAVRLEGSVLRAPAGGNRIVVEHRPVGVVLAVTPWNFPAAMITRKLAPALAAGNAAVVKPAHQTPLTAVRIAELMSEVGVPAGIVNVIPTEDPGPVVEAAARCRPVRLLSFTGSTRTGTALLHLAADRVLRVSMELGGNAPFIVFADADLEAAADGAMVAKMRHSAQTCTAANRFYVEAPVIDRFSALLADRMRALHLGAGRDPDTTCGPLIDESAVERVTGLVADAVGRGAQTVTGGDRVDRAGYFVEPTVLRDVDAEADVIRTEIFGPVAPLVSFDDHDAVVAAANATDAGLASYVYSGDLGLAMRTAEQLQYGMVGINRGAMSDPAAPFGGMRESGLGREGGIGSLHEFTEPQYLAVDW